jgi:hypothetical protein
VSGFRPVLTLHNEFVLKRSRDKVGSSDIGGVFEGDGWCHIGNGIFATTNSTAREAARRATKK